MTQMANVNESLTLSKFGQVKQFQYLGQIFTADYDHSKEIHKTKSTAGLCADELKSIRRSEMKI